MDLPVAMAIDLFAKPYQVKRQVRRGYTRGVLDDPSPVTEPIQAVVQPLGNEEQYEPKGDWGWDGHMVWSRSPLNGSDESVEQDAVVIAGIDHFVTKAWPYNVDGNYYQAAVFAVRSP